MFLGRPRLAQEMILEMCLQIRNAKMIGTIDEVIRISAFLIHTISPRFTVPTSANTMK